MYILSTKDKGHTQYYTHLNRKSLENIDFFETYYLNLIVAKCAVKSDYDIGMSVIQYHTQDIDFEECFSVVEEQDVDYTDDDLNDTLIDLHSLGIKFNLEEHTIDITEHAQLALKEVFYLVDYYGFKLMILNGKENPTRKQFTTRGTKSI